MKIYIVIERDGTNTLVETNAEAFRTKAEAYEYLAHRVKQMNDVEVSNGIEWWSANITEKELKA